MLEQQKLPEPEQTLQHLKIIPKINRIEKQSSRFHDLIARIRDRKFASNQPSQCSSTFNNGNYDTSEISEIQMRSSKMSFELEPIMDRTLKKFGVSDGAQNQHVKSSKIEPRDKDYGIRCKRQGQINGRDSIKTHNFSHLKSPQILPQLGHTKEDIMKQDVSRLKKASPLHQTSFHRGSPSYHHEIPELREESHPSESNTELHASHKAAPLIQMKKDSTPKINHNLFKISQTQQFSFYNTNHPRVEKRVRMMQEDFSEEQHNYQPSKQKQWRKRDISQPLNPERAASRMTTFSKEKELLYAVTSHKTPSKISGQFASRLLNISPEKLIMQFIPFQNSPVPDSSPNLIYEFFTALCHSFGLKAFVQPLIKRYRNCIYFGEKVPKNKSESYEGFVWYYRNALYYGIFQAGRKHGNGVEIDFGKGNHIWKGMFQTGTKTGHFDYFTPQFKYRGMMKNGNFHGEGLLETDKSKYQGNFKAGTKCGYGEEVFTQGKAMYKGEYLDNNFEGEGQLEADNYYYKGSFRGNTANGSGFERTGQYEYFGEFREGKKNGRGSLTMKDGTVFQGSFRDGKAVKEDPQQNSYHYQVGLSQAEMFSGQHDGSFSSHTQNSFSNQGFHRMIGRNADENRFVSNGLYALTEENEGQEGKTTLDYERRLEESRAPFSRMREIKKPQYHEIEQNFPHDQEENEEDPLEPKIV